MAVPVTVPNLRTIVHQEKVEKVIDDRLVASDVAAKQTSAVIATPLDPGATYVEAEVQDLKRAIDQIRAALTASGVTN